MAQSLNFTVRGGSTNKTSDQRSLVLLNSGFQLLIYIINEGCKGMWNRPMCESQGKTGAGRVDVSTSICKKSFCHAWSPQTRKTSLSSRHRLQKRLLCNVAGSSLTLDKYVSIARHWLTEADLRQRNSRLAPNDAESATITFDTGVAQGSITSPQLFNIFINTLLRMLTATGQNHWGISPGLQIGKNQEDSSQGADHSF